MPADVVRVELHVSGEFVVPEPEVAHREYDLMLLAQLADRWAVEADDTGNCVWFEIDRS